MYDLYEKIYDIKDKYDFVYRSRGGELGVKIADDKLNDMYAEMAINVVVRGQSGSMAFIGYDGLGKTSLLNLIMLKVSETDCTGYPAKPLLVRCYDLPAHKGSEFYLSIIESLNNALLKDELIDIRIKQEIGVKCEQCKACPSTLEMKNRLQEIFAELSRKEVCTIIIIDDIHKLTKEICSDTGDKEKAENIKDNFIWLRTLPQNAKVCYIVTSKKCIMDISKEVTDSDFPGIFDEEYIRPFTPKEIRKYLFKCNLPLNKENPGYDIIVKSSGGVPGILRAAVKTFVEAGGEIIDEQEYVRTVAEKCGPILKTCWDYSSIEEQIVLKCLASGEEISGISAEMIEPTLMALKKKNIIRKNDIFVSEVFRCYVRNVPFKKDSVINPGEAVGKDYEVEDDYKEFMQKAIDEAMEKVSQNIEKLGLKLQAAGGDKDPKEIVREALSLPEDLDINKTYHTLLGRSISKVWNKLDEDIRKRLILAERYKDFHYDLDPNKEDTCIKYGKIFERIIKRLVMPVVVMKIQEYHPGFKFRKTNGDMVALDKIPKRKTIGTLDYLLETYVKFAANQNKFNDKKNNDIIRIYEKFEKKLKDILAIRNKCSHDDEDDESETTAVKDSDKAEPVDTDKLELMVNQMLGKDEEDTSGIEYLLQLSELKVHRR